MRHRVARWNGGVVAAVVLAAVGVGTGTGALFVAAAVPLAYVAYGAFATVPAVEETVAVTRAVEPTTVPPSQPVEVTLTVRNDGDSVLPDVRVVDRVPDPLRVLDGTPRGAATLRPGESLTVTYRVLAKRGAFTFDPPRVRCRSLAANAVATADVGPAGDDRLTCRLDADVPPLAEQGRGYAGQLSTDRPGEGVEFHSTREYVPGDPTARIDWRHYAKRDDLATVNYREHRAVDVVLVVDARPPARVVAGPGHPSGVELAAYAATRALAELSGAGHDVGVALLGVADEVWLPPDSGHQHRARARDVIRRAADAADADDRPAGTDAPSTVARRLVDRVAPDTQVLLFSPLLDDEPVEALEVWGATGLARGAVVPDVLATNTVSGQLVGVRRRERLVRCQRAGARVVDWQRGTPLLLALDHALAAERGGAWS